MHLYYNHTLYSFPLYTFLWAEDGPKWPKHVVVIIINRIQDNCVLMYPTPSPSHRLLLQVADLQMMFLPFLFAEFDSLKQERLVRWSKFVAHIVALDLPIPLIPLWRLPWNLECVLVFSLHLHGRCWATGNWNTDANTAHRDNNTDFKILNQRRRAYTYRAASGHLNGLIQFIYLIFTAWFYNTAVF